MLGLGSGLVAAVVDLPEPRVEHLSDLLSLSLSGIRRSTKEYLGIVRNI